MAAANAEGQKKGKFSPRGFISRISRFFSDMKGEAKRVVWPTKKQVINNTLIVIGFVVIAALFIAGIDSILSLLVQFFLKRA